MPWSRAEHIGCERNCGTYQLRRCSLCTIDTSIMALSSFAQFVDVSAPSHNSAAMSPLKCGSYVSTSVP